MSVFLNGAYQSVPDFFSFLMSPLFSLMHLFSFVVARLYIWVFTVMQVPFTLCMQFLLSSSLQRIVHI